MITFTSFPCVGLLFLLRGVSRKHPLISGLSVALLCTQGCLLIFAGSQRANVKVSCCLQCSLYLYLRQRNLKQWKCNSLILFIDSFDFTDIYQKSVTLSQWYEIIIVIPVDQTEMLLYIIQRCPCQSIGALLCALFNQNWTTHRPLGIFCQWLIGASVRAAERRRGPQKHKYPILSF